MNSHIDARLAERLCFLRQEKGWSLDELAEHSDISRATLSRLERGETSPTAALLGRLCTVYGRTMSRLLAEVESDPPELLRQADQPVWTDPATGFRRRNVSPPAHGFLGELVEGTLMPGATIAYENAPVAWLEHHLWMLEGTLLLEVEGVSHRLLPGDCLRFRVNGPTRYSVPGPAAARYLIAICRP